VRGNVEESEEFNLFAFAGTSQCQVADGVDSVMRPSVGEQGVSKVGG